MLLRFQIIWFNCQSNFSNASKVLPLKTNTIIMKKVALLSMLFACLAFNSFSQLFFSAHRDRIIMDFNADLWSNQPTGVEMKSLSRTFNITMFRDIRLDRNFAIGIGLGFSGSNVYTNSIFEDSNNSSPWALSTQGSGYNFKQIASNFELKGNKLYLGYFNLPVEVRYRNLNTPHLFRVSLGAKVGYLSTASTKVAVENQGGVFGAGSQTDFKYKELGVKNINKVQFGLSARVGYGRFGVNAYLPLTPVFKENQSTDMNFFSIGISMFML
jgi:hypothetical protein